MVNGEIMVPDEPGLGIHLTDDIIENTKIKKPFSQREVSLGTLSLL